MSDPVLLATTDGIALLTLNRPHKLNALNYQLIDQLMAHLDRIEVAPELRAVIVTGAGDRAFSAGGDIHEFSKSVSAGADTAVRDFVRRGQALTARLEAFPKPVIAAVNGLAFGGGCEITEAVHLAIASDRAVFAKPEIILGMPPTFGGTQRLPRLAGRKRALELLLTGDPFSAARALELGLINAVVPHHELLSAAQQLAARIVRHSPLAIRSILTAVTRGLNMSIGEGLQVESEQFASLVPTHDLAEGLAAWIERRPPLYTRGP
jgi:enoyl-CoA hydratase/carnithine racemase